MFMEERGKQPVLLLDLPWMVNIERNQQALYDTRTFVDFSCGDAAHLSPVELGLVGQREFPSFAGLFDEQLIQ